MSDRASSAERYSYSALLDFATALGEKLDMPPAMARVQAEIFVEADLMGHTTHGLNLLPNALKEIQSGQLQTAGEPTVVSDKHAAVLWDGNRLPGTWLVVSALEEAMRRMSETPVIAWVIRRSGHVGALSPYLLRASRAGYVVTMMTTNPNMRTVVPAGGKDPLIAPNPIGFGYPTQREPILIDISTAAVANGWIRRWASEKRSLPEKWLQDSEGNLTDDPAALFGSPPGALLPLGGPLLAHKGFALGLMVETLTGGLSGVGHTGIPADAGNLVYLQLVDPAAFVGHDLFVQDTSALAEQCRISRPRPGFDSVRMPGDMALALRHKQMSEGIDLYPSIMPDLVKWASKLGVAPPQPIV